MVDGDLILCAPRINEPAAGTFFDIKLADLGLLNPTATSIVGARQSGTWPSVNARFKGNQPSVESKVLYQSTLWGHSKRILGILSCSPFASIPLINWRF